MIAKTLRGVSGISREPGQFWMSYQIYLFVPGKDEGLEDAYERQCCRGWKDFEGQSQTRADEVISRLLLVEPSLESSRRFGEIDLCGDFGIQISIYGTGGATISIPYWDHGPEAAERLSQFVSVFEECGFYFYDPQTGEFNGEAGKLHPRARQGFLPDDQLLSMTLKASSRMPDHGKIREELYSYFRDRSRYVVSSNLAHYCNFNTGVTFSFELPEPSGRRSARVRFMLDLGRPDPFALEADLELLAFTNALEFQLAEDTHSGNEPYQSQKLFDAWERETSYAIRRYLFMGGDVGVYKQVRGEPIHQFWQWNFNFGRIRAIGAGTVARRLRLFKDRQPMLIGRLGETLLAPKHDVWIALPDESEDSYRAMPADALTCLGHGLLAGSDQVGQIEYRTISIPESFESVPDGMSYSAEEIDTALNSLNNVIQTELVEKGIEENKHGSRSC